MQNLAMPSAITKHFRPFGAIFPGTSHKVSPGLNVFSGQTLLHAFSGASFVAGPLATMDRLGPRHCLASSRAALQSVGFLGGARVPLGRRERGSLFPRFRGTRRWPRPETWGGNAATMAAAVAASKVGALAADALVDDAGDVVASDGDTGEAREDPESALFFLVACAVAVGLCASHWIAACRAEALRVIDPPAPANVAACPHSPRPSFLLFL